MQPGDSYEAPIYTAKEAYVAADQHDAEQPPQRLGHLVPYSWPRTSSNDDHRPVQLRALPAGDELQLRDGRPALSRSPPSMPTVPRTTPRSLPTTADPATGHDPLGRLHGHAARRRRHLLRHGPDALLQPVRRHPVHGYAPCRSFVTSSPITFPTGMAGGMGRKGAQKVIIFETDGLPTARRPPAW